MKFLLFIVLGVFFFARVRTRTIIRINALIFSLLLLLPLLALASNQNLQHSVTNIANPKLNISLPAIESLGRSKDPQAVAPLSQAFANEQRSLVRRYLVDALGQLGFPQGRATLIKALKDNDAQVRQSAVAALSIVGGKDSDEALMQQADNEKDPAVVSHLIFHLGQMRDPRALGKLQKLQNSKDPKISDMAKQELKKHMNNGTN